MQEDLDRRMATFDEKRRAEALDRDRAETSLREARLFASGVSADFSRLQGFLLSDVRGEAPAHLNDLYRTTAEFLLPLSKYCAALARSVDQLPKQDDTPD